MASLEELKKRLYKKEETFSERAAEPNLYRPPVSGGADQLSRPSIGAKIPAIVSRFSRRHWLIAGGILIVVFVVALYGIQSLFNVQAVEVKIVGEQAIKSGERITWRVEITNHMGRLLKDVSVVFVFPEGAVPLSPLKTPGVLRERRTLAEIRPGETVSESFDAYIFGGRGVEKKASASVEYRPDGTSAFFAKDTFFPFSIVQSPVSISFSVPDELRIGQEAELIVHYVSQSDEMISDLLVHLAFPEGFEYADAEPLPRDKQKFEWNVGALKPAGEGSITIRGIIRGSNLESKNFRASIGVLQSGNIADATKDFLSYDEVIKPVVLRSPFLEVGLSPSNEKQLVLFAGDTVSIQVDWKNNLPEELRGVSLEVGIDGSAVNFSSIRAERGIYSEAKRAIVWNSSTYNRFLRVLPDESDTVSFSFQIRNNLTLDVDAPRPTVKLKAVLKPPGSVPGFEGIDVSGTTALELKIASKLQLVSRALYFQSPFSNAGVLPPKVGEETTYTVIWSLANTANDVDGVVVRSSLPPYMSFKNIISPADANVVFDQSTGSVEWRPGRVRAGTGFVRPAPQIAFQVGLVPSDNQVGTSPVIINDTEATGRDTFTNSMLSSKDARIGIDLPDDPNVTSAQKKVVR